METAAHSRADQDEGQCQDEGRQEHRPEANPACTHEFEDAETVAETRTIGVSDHEPRQGEEKVHS